MPGKIGSLMSISAKMQPTLQTSMEVEYFFQERMSSGARYHLVVMYSVMTPVLP